MGMGRLNPADEPSRRYVWVTRKERSPNKKQYEQQDKQDDQSTTDPCSVRTPLGSWLNSFVSRLQSCSHGQGWHFVVHRTMLSWCDTTKTEGIYAMLVLPDHRSLGDPWPDWPYCGWICIIGVFQLRRANNFFPRLFIFEQLLRCNGITTWC